ncbi:MAG: response regulator [Deltaproteobacteria bacterium]|nr:response regulator [Deltaproteobacteria bacterium]
MAKTKITFHILIDDRKCMEQVSSALQSLDYDILINSGAEKLPELNLGLNLKLNKDDFNIIILNPGFSSWEWLDRLIKIDKRFPDLPVILYASEITDRLYQVADNSTIFLAHDKVSLTQRVKDIIISFKISKTQILFVDDEKKIIKTYLRMLRKLPWTLFIASNGINALEILEKERIDLVVTDIKMPNMHGLELVAKIREQDHNLPIIICSAYKGMKADQDLVYYNVSAFMDKPVDQDALLNKIKELIA